MAELVNNVDEAYADLIAACLGGEKVLTRNAECFRTLCVAYEFRSTPLVSARKTAWKNCLREWQWFLSGSNKVADLHPSVRSWWMPWADDKGEVWGNYSRQFRNAYGYANQQVDQIDALVKGVYQHPHSRRNVITTWNTCDMTNPWCPITNCHGTIIQCFVSNSKLTLYTYQRSADVVVGVPHNWLQYWSFLLWLAHRTELQVGSLIWQGGDCHVYSQHEELARRIVAASPGCGPTPLLAYRAYSQDFLADDFSLIGDYRPIITERAEMVV